MLLRIPQKVFVQQSAILLRACHSMTYIQGQSPEPRVREYFYYMDHQGMLFMDDSKMKNFTSCFKDKQFLKFFISRITDNHTGRYFPEFPYVSLCGRERNFLRCDDLPFVFTYLLQQQQQQQQRQRKQEEQQPNAHLLSYNHCDRLMTTKFQPEKICMVPDTGRVYHPADRKPEVGLISDKLSMIWIEEKRFVFEDGESNPPTHFMWKKEKMKLTNELIPILEKIRLKLNTKV